MACAASLLDAQHLKGQSTYKQPYVRDSSPLWDKAKNDIQHDISKKLFTDWNETWWTGWVYDNDELIRFYWRSNSGSGSETFLFIEVILLYWEIGRKTIYGMMSQKVVDGFKQNLVDDLGRWQEQAD